MEEKEFSYNEINSEVKENLNDTSNDEAENNDYSCQTVTIPRELIVETSDNVECGYNIDEESIIELAYSIHDFGLASPLNVIPQDDGTYYLAGGHRRIRALRYGDEMGWNWFPEGYPCIISQRTSNTDTDRKIYIHELNIHNRNNNDSYFDRVSDLWTLYKKREQETDPESCSKSYTASAKIIGKIAEKLGISQRQAYTHVYIANGVAEWIKEACEAGKIRKDYAYQIGHMPEHLQDEVKEYLEAHGSITNEKMKEFGERKFIEVEAPEWLKSAVDQKIISVAVAAKIGAGTKESKEKLRDYYEKNAELTSEIISELLVDKRGNSYSLPEIKAINLKSREEMLIESVVSGEENLKSYRDPVDFDISKEFLGKTEEYSDNSADNESYDDNEDEYGNMGMGWNDYHEPDHRSKESGYNSNSYTSSSYDAAENSDYDDSDSEDYNENEYSEEYDEDFGSEEEYDEADYNYDKESDDHSSFSEKPETHNGDNKEEKPAENKTSAFKHSPSDNEGSSGKSKDLIMSDSLWWFTRMAENENMSSTESVYVDTMFLLSNSFYFNTFKQRLEAGMISDEIKECVKKTIELLSTLEV